ncbi:UxaA family hydrolase [Ferruginibacter albus]|uniref:UxaA family hydrolase n=1 Tax=Ferruginibacter albus TaxID=2875540 RepID=UPI001CC7A2F4|nr:altronate dehydratase family protein [Ferruginibacter albus]UAY50606.1 altronate dehydratase family protein [Ferruginibacter albus]
MNKKVIKVNADDNVIVALTDLQKGETVEYNGESFTLQTDVAAKHKFVTGDLKIGDEIHMYGVLVGKASEPIAKGARITTTNIKHAVSGEFVVNQNDVKWNAPDVSKWKGKEFLGYHRSDGKVGTANYWLVVPLVFCENRNIEILKEAFLKELGFAKPNNYQQQVKELVKLKESGASMEEILNFQFTVEASTSNQKSAQFPNIDGIKFLTHEGGCGGIRQDANVLCSLLASYITHPNVAGATVLSLGCQNAQISILEEEIAKRNPTFDRPLFILDHQQSGSEPRLLTEAINKTFAGLVKANETKREPAPLTKLTIGVKCGGSDGFSGISANPAVGYVSDIIVGLGGSSVLAEFPELCGVEQELVNRTVKKEDAEFFLQLMKKYAANAAAVGSGFDMNPSPGNIKDGLITDAMKSAGAAKKGGTSPIVDVLDYPQQVKNPGLSLLCTPGNDVEAVTGLAAAHSNIVLFTTGLGTPTGNPVAPTIKISSNTKLFNKMHDIIDVNTGTVIEGDETIEQAGGRLFDYILKVASGEEIISAVRNGQDDFIPWKRGVSL